MVKTMRRPALLAAALAALLAASLPAFAEASAEPPSFPGKPAALRPGLGVLVALNLDSSSITPSLVTSDLSVGFEYPIGAGFGFEPAFSAYWAYYELSSSYRAVPTEISEREATVFGLLADFPLVYTLGLGKGFELSAGLGLGLNLRGGIKAASDVGDETVKEINYYFWSAGRYFLPSTLLRAEYRLNDKLDACLGGKLFWPIFNLWAGEDLPFFDQAIVEASLSVRYRLR